MCGRYAIATTADRIEEAFDAVWETAALDGGRGTTANIRDIIPRYNIAPTQSVPVIRAKESRRVISLLRWGLVPSWADDPSIGNRLINARAETASSKPSFRSAWKRRRCLVPITHFYEWRKDGAQKQPMAITSSIKNATVPLMALAGLWESWRDELKSFTILTTSPNALLRSIHDRMPVILPRDRWTRWLDPEWTGPASESELSEWTAPAPEGALRAFPVSTTVNSPRNESSSCLEPMPV